MVQPPQHLSSSTSKIICFDLHWLFDSLLSNFEIIKNPIQGNVRPCMPGIKLLLWKLELNYLEKYCFIWKVESDTRSSNLYHNFKKFSKGSLRHRLKKCVDKIYIGKFLCILGSMKVINTFRAEETHKKYMESQAAGNRYNFLKISVPFCFDSKLKIKCMYWNTK